MTDPLAFIHDLRWDDLTPHVQAQTKRSLLDLIGVAAGGASTRASAIMRDLSAVQMGGTLPMMLDDRTASAAGVALAAGMTIDALDGHDGFNPSKGHIGCTLFAAILPQAQQVSGKDFLAALTMGYEFGARAAMAQHGTVPDFHTSGSWGAVTGAAALARLMHLDHDQTRHALGIAEYHGPRSQMMRCIDHPTMLKDGAGFGALAAVTAAELAQRGFTGAPAITVEAAPAYWADLGQRWYMLEQYYKPYPVCRWAQAPVEAILALRQAHGLTAADVRQIRVKTFHESIRLATATPHTTEEAQYSTSFPCALAMVRGGITAADLADDALEDAEVLRLSQSLVMDEDDHANAVFPGQRLAQVTLTLASGETVVSDWTEPKWDATAPPTEAELRAKYHALADGPLGAARAAAIEDAIDSLESTPAAALADLLSQPIRA